MSCPPPRRFRPRAEQTPQRCQLPASLELHPWALGRSRGMRGLSAKLPRGPLSVREAAWSSPAAAVSRPPTSKQSGFTLHRRAQPRVEGAKSTTVTRFRPSHQLRCRAAEPRQSNTVRLQQPRIAVGTACRWPKCREAVYVKFIKVQFMGVSGPRPPPWWTTGLTRT